jgi:ATP-dependent DNA helicase RecG
MSFSQHNSSLTAEEIRVKPENAYLERKGRDMKATKIANELIGMLNAGGGTLVYGIADDGTVEDLAGGELLAEGVAEHLRPYRTLVHDFIAPPAIIELEEVFMPGGELVFLYHAEPNHERLFQRKDNEEVYLRVADSNRGPLPRDEVKKLEYNKSIRSYEDEPRADFDPADLDTATCAAYREALRYDGSFTDLALKRHLATSRDGQVIYKNAAILLFAKDPEKYIPNASVRYVRYEGTERKSGGSYNVVKEQRFEANIPSIIARAKVFIDASMRDYYYLDMEVGKFLRVSEFPEEAWLEGLVNALCHRSYNLQGNPVLIRHFDDRLEISNSGPLPAYVTVENIQCQRYARNPRIARVLTDLGYVRELNEGVPRIYSAMEEFRLAEPQYVDHDNLVTLTLRSNVAEHKETILGETLVRIETRWEMLNKSQRDMIHLLYSEQEATVAEFSAALGLSEQAIRYNLKTLERLGIVQRFSEKIRDKNAVYRFKEK